MPGKEEILKSLSKEMQLSAWDIKAEAQVLLAMEKGLLQDDFMAVFDTLFKREYSRDVISAQVKDDAKKQAYLQVRLSRAGIYDQLPEGLFFQMPQRSSKMNTAASMSAHYKLNKKKEEDIKRFFQPFEMIFSSPG